ncbi:MAG TPA: carboxypeptidase M32 [Solirubrobacteraceae bacterium]|nr:carboxypeptidase M32 [Solirubrobacteraceae bacterium]
MEEVTAAGEAFALLRERMSELADLEAISGLLDWDQETMMPARGARARAEHVATVERLHHERLTAPEVGVWLDSLNGDALDDAAAMRAEPADPADRDHALLRVTRRDRGKALRVPRELHAELARARSTGQHVWAKARSADDFEAFLPQLRLLIDLTRRYVDCFPDAEHPYDPLLDDYEPGMRTAQVVELFARLREGLGPLVAEIARARDEGRAPEALDGPFSTDDQRRLVRRMLVDVGFDPLAGRLDESEHPFSTTTALGDQRITARFGEHSLEAMFAGLHEFGHALYDSQVDAALEHTPLCTGVSSALHESQSRLWENMVGRSRAGAEYLLPLLREEVGGVFAAMDADELYRRVNVVRPSLIRVEADEVNYALHIILRFELELELFEGTLQAEDLAGAWRERASSYLGIDVPDDAHGVLQDIHWAFGGFGYFPTYALGNLIAAMLWARIRADLPDIDARVATAEFGPLREWLREHVHRFGRMLTPAQTLRRATGSEIAVEPFLDYLWEKHAGVHGVHRGGASRA